MPQGMEASIRPAPLFPNSTPLIYQFTRCCKRAALVNSIYPTLACIFQNQEACVLLHPFNIKLFNDEVTWNFIPYYKFLPIIGRD
jgi:hypothetical protein